MTLTLAGKQTVVSDQPNPLWNAIREVRSRWRLLLAIPFGAAVLAVIVSFLVTKEYEGVAMFGPAEDISGTLPANLATIAAQFGVTAGSGGESVDYLAPMAPVRE